MARMAMLSSEEEAQTEDKPIRNGVETDEENGEIRHGVPTLASLFNFQEWNARLRAREYKKQKAKRRSNKDVQVTTPPPAHTIPDSINGAALGSSTGCPEEECQPRVRFAELEPPRTPSPAVNAPPVPVQTIESQSSLTEPTDAHQLPPHTPQTVEQSSTSNIAVSVPMSKLERLRQMEFRRSKELKGKEIRLEKHDIEKLHTFSDFVGTPNQMTLFGRQLPRCHCYVVQLELDGSDAQTYICIDGLKDKEDIRLFYAVMSQQKYRKYYESWKICFRMVEVLNSASSTTDGPGMEEAAASYQIELQKGKLTLTGSRVKVTTDIGERISTIGGIIQIGPELYALTTAHGSSWPDRTSSTMVESRPPPLREEDFSDDVEKVLVIVDDTDLTEIHPAEVALAHLEELVSSKIYEHHGDDWCLIPVLEQHQLPNGFSISGNPVEEIYLENPGGLRVTRFASARAEQGTVGYAPSFLDGPHGSIEVWVVNLHSGSAGLCPGDSGSWFVTRFAGRGDSPKVVGQVVARSAGKVLITLLSGQMESIARSFPNQPRPALPRAVPMLLRAAKNYYTTNHTTSERFVDQLLALVTSGTPRFSDSALALTLRKAHENILLGDDSDVDELKTLIMKAGEDLERNIQEECLRLPKDVESLTSLPVGPVPLIRKLALIYQNVESKWKPQRSIRYSQLLPPGGMADRLTLPTPASAIKVSPHPQWDEHDTEVFIVPIDQATTRAPPLTTSVPAHRHKRVTFQFPDPPGTSSSQTNFPISHLVFQEPANTDPDSVTPTPESTSKEHEHHSSSTLGLGSSIIASLCFPSISPNSPKHIYATLILVIFTSYFIGLGIAAWKLLASDLTSETKIGVGIALIALAGLGCWIIYSRRRRRQHHSPGGDG